MPGVRVCRVCLIHNSRMLSLDPQLQAMFELLGNTKLITKDGRPETVCYVCYSQLQKCHKIMQVAREAEHILTQLLCDGLKLTQDAIAMRGAPLISLVIHPITLYNYPYDKDAEVEYSLTGDVKHEHEESDNFPIEFDDDPFCEDVKLDIDEDFGAIVNEASVTKEIKKEYTEIEDKINHVYESSSVKEGLAITSSIAKVNKQTKRPHACLKPFACDFCDKKFLKNNRLQRHIKVHTGNTKPFACDECKKVFSDKRTLIIHIRNHTAIKPYACKVCNKKCTTIIRLKNHMTIHDHKIFACSRCDRTFPVLDYLKSHMIVHGTGGRARPACDRCGKTFFDKSVLKKHMKIHTGEKPFTCDVCNKTFAEKGNLKRHIRIHTEERPYACDMCDKAFSESGNLKTHKRVHTGEKPYTCDACGKGFSQPKSLKTHLTTHTGERKFSCVICCNTFTAKNSLKIHMRIHSGEKPFTCNVCSKSFYESTSLRRHKRTHTGENPYTCIECNKSFSRKAYLQKHVKFCKRK